MYILYQSATFPLSQLQCVYFREQTHSHLSRFTNNQNIRFRTPEIPHSQWDNTPSYKMYMCCSLQARFKWQGHSSHSRSRPYRHIQDCAQSTYTECHPWHPAWYVLQSSFSLGLQSAVGEGDSGNHLFWPWIPKLFTLGLTQKLYVVHKPVCSLRLTSEVVAEDTVDDILFDTDNNFVVHLLQVH